MKRYGKWLAALLALALLAGLLPGSAWAADSAPGEAVYDEIALQGLSQVVCLGEGTVVPAKRDGKWGLIDTAEHAVVPFVYDRIQVLCDENGAVAGFLAGTQMFDRAGKAVFSLAEYDRFLVLSENEPAYSIQKYMYVLVYKDGKTGAVSSTGRMIVPLQDGGLETSGDEGGPIIGFRSATQAWDTAGRLLFTADGYDGLAFVYDNEYFVVSKNEQWTVVDAAGNVIVPLQQEWPHAWRDKDGGLAGFRMGATLTDLTGRVIFSGAEYGTAEPHGGTCIWVTQGSYPDIQYGVLDLTGQVLIPLQADMISCCYDSARNVVGFRDKDTYWDLAGQEMFSGDGYTFNGFYDGESGAYFRVGKDGKTGVMDSAGQMIVPLQDREPLPWYGKNGKLAGFFNMNRIWDLTGRELFSYDGGMEMIYRVPGVFAWRQEYDNRCFMTADGTVLLSGVQDQRSQPFLYYTAEKLADRLAGGAEQAQGGSSVVSLCGLQDGARTTLYYDVLTNEIVGRRECWASPVNPEGWFVWQAENGKYGIGRGTANTTGFVDVPPDEYYAEPVQWAVEQGITNGTSAFAFSPLDTCTRGQIVTFLWRAAGRPEPESGTNPFGDVPESEYYYKAVLWAVEQGITNGTSPTTFGPDEPCTRGQVVTFLHRAQKTPEPAGHETPFTDVPESEYYYKAVQWAVEQGVTNGTSPTTFGPEETCLRGQIVTFLYRALAKA